MTRMRIGIDLRWLQRAYINSPAGALGGMGIVIENLWRGLAETAPELTLVGLVNKGPVPAPLSALIKAAPRAEAHRIGRLAVGDGEQPRAKVLAVAESRVGAQGSHERLLEAILRRVRPDASDEEPMQLDGVVVDEALKRRQAHAG